MGFGFSARKTGGRLAVLILLLLPVFSMLVSAVDPTVTITFVPAAPGPGQTVTVTATAVDTNLPPVAITSVSIAGPASATCAGSSCSVSWTAPNVAGNYMFYAYATNANSEKGSSGMLINIGGCTISIIPSMAAAGPVLTFDLGDDFSVAAMMWPCPSPGDKMIKFYITDPNGVTHQAEAVTNGGGTTPFISFLKAFDKGPSTDICGRYTVRAVYNEVEGTLPIGWNDINGIIPTSKCEVADGNIATKVVNCGAVQSIVNRDLLNCCTLGCCHGVTFDSGCQVTGSAGWNPAAIITDTAVESKDLQQPDMDNLCTIPNAANPNTYDVRRIDTTQYRVLGKNSLDNGNLEYYLIDKVACIVADTNNCNQKTDILVIDKEAYLNYVVNNVFYEDTGEHYLCRGFETAWTPPYDAYTGTYRYVDVYGLEYTAYFYCYSPLVPNIVRASRWCHDINLGWYSVVKTTTDIGSGVSINRQKIDAIRRWNALSGLIVLGHVCPWCESDPFTL